MTTAARHGVRPVPRAWVFAAFNALVLAGGAVVLGLTVGDVASHVASATLWLLVGLTILSGTQAFIALVGPEGLPAVVTPTVAFAFAILIDRGLGPAVFAQTIAVVVAAWRLRRPVFPASLAAARYALALAAASGVLSFGSTDLFSGGDLAKEALLLLAAAVAWLAVYGLLFVGTWVGSGRPVGRAVIAVRDQVLFKAALLLLSPVLAFAAHVNILLVPLVLIPLYAVQRMARLSAERDIAVRRDPLTGLANRAGLKAAFDRLISAPIDLPEQGVGRQISLLVLDLDRFKQVNDALGHDVGDQLLVAITERLPRLEPSAGVVARLGGDEFAVLTATRDPQQVADDVARAMDRPIHLDGVRVDVTASVGIATHTDDNEDFSSLMRRADVAMYEAKQRGDTVAVYSSRTDRNNPAQLALLADFREALEADDHIQIGVYYQPQAALATGEVNSVEALLRWRHPSRGLVPPQEILDLAEHTPAMLMLTARVVERATAQLAAWTSAGIDLRVSVNVSARDLYSDDMIDHLATQLSRHHVDPTRLQVEITESALLADLHRAAEPLRRIADLGVSVSLDDFGTGYSSLQHLRRLPISEIKIDRSFVSGMADSRDDEAIVRSTVDLARSLDIRTVAEGVENATTWRLLAEVGCTLAQGWHAARPMPGHAVPDWLVTAGSGAGAEPSGV